MTTAAAAVEGAKEPLEQVKTYDGQKSPRLVLILLPGHGVLRLDGDGLGGGVQAGVGHGG